MRKEKGHFEARLFQAVCRGSLFKNAAICWLPWVQIRTSGSYMNLSRFKCEPFSLELGLFLIEIQVDGRGIVVAVSLSCFLKEGKSRTIAILESRKGR